jgi:Domain of unknown function (DUF309)
MSIPPSGASKLPLPRWAYVPGETDEADADYEALARAKLLVPPRFRGYVPARHPAIRYALALNDAGYFWELQEVLEAVWAAAPQGGASGSCCGPVSRSPTPISACGCASLTPLRVSCARR